MGTFNMTKTFALISFLAVIAFATAMWFQQLQSNTVMAQNQSVLTLEASTLQRKYPQLEPIPISFKLSNQTAVPVMWNGTLMFGRDLNFLIRRSNGDEVRREGRRYSVDTPLGETEIMQPNENKEAQELISGDLTEQLFPVPGRYELRVELNYVDFSYGQRQNVTILSNSIIIDIEKPKGKDLRAYNYLKTIYEPINRSSNVNELIRVKQFFADNFSDSVYWKYMTYSLASTYLMFNEDEKAENEFYKISDVDFYYSKKVEWELDKLAIKLKRSTRRTKRPPVPTDVPIASSVPVPTVTPGPPLENIPAPILIPNPTP